jgi:hypothetical protein
LAKGDVVSGLSSIAAGAYLTIQPTAPVEEVIHNIYHEYDVQLEFYDGSNALVFDAEAGAGVYARYAFHCTNDRYIRVKNTHGSLAKLIGFDGVITRT